MIKALTLQELTGHESGAILYPDGEIWIGNWSGVDGIPRQFATGTIGLGEPLTAKICKPPTSVLNAMWDHELEQGNPISRKGFRAWIVNDDYTVVVQGNWA